MTAPTVKERVAAGAAWLDEHEPGWWQRINLGTLVMRDSCGCVLGQLYGTFSAAPVPSSLSVALGFDRNRIGPPRTGAADWAALDVAWRDLITARRTAAPSTVVGAS